MVLPLILLTFSVFLTLWIADFYLTLKTSKRAGYSIEINPIINLLLRARSRYVWIFKFVELAVFFYLVYFLTIISETAQFYILLFYIVLYGFLVVNNSKVYFEVFRKQSLVMSIALMLVVIFIALFIYLNFLLYSNLTTSYDVLTKCKSSFNDLYWSCQQNITSPVSLPSELENILKSLNLTIARPFQ